MNAIAFAATPGSATGTALVPEVERVAERKALLAVDKMARDGAVYCWENASSTEAIGVGDRFWLIHCELLKLLGGGEGQGESGNDSEPCHSPSDGTHPLRAGDAQSQH